MTHDVFISYSAHDNEIAFALCGRLEQDGIRCWIAPRDVPAGRTWAASISEAVRAARLVLVLLSASANDSPHVVTEVAIAVDEHVPLLPVGLGEALATGDLDYYTRRWHRIRLLAMPTPADILKLQDAIRLMLATELSQAPAPGNDFQPSHTNVDESGGRGGRLRTLLHYSRSLRRELSERFSNELVRPDHVYVLQRVSRLFDTGAPGSLVEVVEGFWQGRTPRVAVLGNYGMGKTYFTWRTALDQLTRAEDRLATLPIVYPLRKFSYAEFADEDQTRRKDLLTQVLEQVKSLDLPDVTPVQFRRWLEDGTVGLILDGLDELALSRKGTWRDVLAPLLQIDGIRLLITSRTTYLEDPKRELAGFDTYELQPWGESEWLSYVASAAHSHAVVSAGGHTQVVSAVAARPSLRSLTSRPLWCYMIVAIADEIQAVDDLGISNLYQRFFDRAIKRRAMADALLPPAWIYAALERFAEECASRGSNDLSESELLRMWSRLFESVGHSQLRQFVVRDLRRYAFLNCNADRHYGFGHKSFDAYFLAASSARWLVEQATSASVTLRAGVPDQLAFHRRRFSDEEHRFLLGILRDDEVLRSLYLVSEDSVGHSPQTAILLYLQSILTERSRSASPRHNSFRIYLEMLRHNQRRPRVIGISLAGVNLTGLDLSECDFEGIDFTDAVLSSGRLAQSTFHRCIFFGCNVDGADFTGADLAAADLVGIELPRRAAPPILTGIKGLESARMTARERLLLGRLDP